MIPLISFCVNVFMETRVAFLSNIDISTEYHFNVLETKQFKEELYTSYCQDTLRYIGSASEN